MNKLKLYDLARSCLVDFTNGDVTASILKEYAVKGMYSLLSCLQSLGIDGKKSRLLALPDFTFSRNDLRYSSNFPYGTILYIDANDRPFMPLGFRPNCCGITMVELRESDFDINSIRQRLRQLHRLDVDISVDDLNRGNHFVGFYLDVQNNTYYALIHGSFSFVKSGHNSTPGLYIDKTTFWEKKMQVFHDGDINYPYLLDEAAEEYFDAYLQHELHTKTLRGEVASFLFPQSRIIFNKTHEGIFSLNTLVLGAYTSAKPFNCPVLLSAESDLPILQINKPFSELPFALYGCPHGGGYSLTHIDSGSYNVENQLYSLQFANGAIMETNDIRKLIYDYRHNTDRVWTEKYGYGEITKKLQTKYNLKL